MGARRDLNPVPGGAITTRRRAVLLCESARLPVGSRLVSTVALGSTHTLIWRHFARPRGLRSANGAGEVRWGAIRSARPGPGSNAGGNCVRRGKVCGAMTEPAASASSVRGSP